MGNFVPDNPGYKLQLCRNRLLDEESVWNPAKGLSAKKTVRV